MLKILKYILKILSKLILKKYKPEVIAITGSVGKTSTKEAIGQILSEKFRVRRTSGNLNNEIGVPLTIIGLRESPERSFFGWIFVFLKAFFLLIFKDKKYPDKLILEMGADHPGDIEYLINFIPIKIAILTRISNVHTEFFKTMQGVFEEKKKIFNNLSKEGYAILNNDDDNIRNLKNVLKCKCLTYGIKNESDVWATDIQIMRKDNVIGMNFKIRYNGNVVPVFLPDSLSLAQVYAFLAGVAVAIVYGINLVKISIFAKNYISPKGRTHLINGIKNSYIIDDTYNSNPDALKIAVDLLSDMSTIISGKKIAVLGDMLELGDDSVVLHREIGKYIADKISIDYVLTTGELAENIYICAKENGLNNGYHFSNKEELIKFLKSILETDSLILVKGSQKSRMEKIVKEIMKSPGLASKLLVRQNESWLDDKI